MVPFKDIFDVLNSARKNKDTVTIAFSEGLDNVAKLRIEDSSAQAGITRYVKFYNNDIRKFNYIDQADFEEMYAGLEMKTNVPEEPVSAPKEEYSFDQAVQTAISIIGSLADVDYGNDTLKFNVTLHTLEQMYYVTKYGESALDVYLEDAGEGATRAVLNVDFTPELRKSAVNKALFSGAVVQCMLGDFESVLLNSIPSIPSTDLAEAHRIARSKLLSIIGGLDVELNADLAPVSALRDAIEKLSDDINLCLRYIATLEYRKRELESGGATKFFVMELSTILTKFANRLAVYYSLYVYSELLNGYGAGAVFYEHLVSFIESTIEKSAQSMKREVIQGRLLKEYDLDTAWLTSFMDKESKGLPEQLLKNLLEGLKTPNRTGYFPEETTDEEKAEFEDQYADRIEELATLRETILDLLREHDSYVSHTHYDEACDSVALRVGFARQALEEAYESSKLDYDAEQLDRSIELLNGSLVSEFKTVLTRFKDGYDLGVELGEGLLSYASDILDNLVEDLETDISDLPEYTVDEYAPMLEGGKYHAVLTMVRYQLADLLERAENVPKGDPIFLSLAVLVTIFLADMEEHNLPCFDILAEDYVPKDSEPLFTIEPVDPAYDAPAEEAEEESVVVEDDAEEEPDEAVSKANDLKELLRGTILEPDDFEEELIAKYNEGVRQGELLSCYNISTGKLYSILRRHGVEPKSSNSKVAKKVAHVEEDADTLKQVLQDYVDGKTLSYIYSKYDLYKNGLFYLLDKYQVPRRQRR